MKMLIAFILTMFSITNGFAQLICTAELPQNKTLDSMVQSADVMKCLATRTKYECVDVEEGLEGSEKNKVIQCDKKSLDNNKMSNISFTDCIWNGMKISGEQLSDIAAIPGKLAGVIAQGFKDTQLCNQSVDKKREILNAFNLTIEDDRFKLSEQFLGNWLADAPCSEIEKLVSSRYQNYQNTLMRERKAAIDTGKKPRDLTGAVVDKKSPGLSVLLQTAMAEVRAKYECYTPKVKAEMVCAGVTTLLVDTALGGGVAMAAKRIGAIVKSKKALNGISRAAAGGEEIDLANSAKLIGSDRKKAAVAVLERDLTKVQEDAVLAAHEIGLKEGRGYYTYTSDDLLKKNRILKEAGFSQVERERLMRSGITGQFSTDEAAKVVTASIEKKMKYSTPNAKNAAVRQFNITLREYNATTDPVLKANYARLLGEMSGNHDVKTAKAFYQLGFEKVKSIPDKDPKFFGRTKTLDNYLDLAARSGDQSAVSKSMGQYVKREYEVDAKRLGWKNTAEAANEIYQRLEDEVLHQLKNAEAGSLYVAAARRKQKALLEEFKFIDQTGRRAQTVNAELARFSD